LTAPDVCKANHKGYIGVAAATEMRSSLGPSSSPRIVRLSKLGQSVVVAVTRQADWYTT
jgi:hypothetical protein